MVLPDVLTNDLKVVFCGTAPGNVSAQEGAYYANCSNKFWEMLYKMGLTEEKMLAKDFQNVLACGIGLTDMAKERFGMDKVLKKDDFDQEAFEAKILKYQPRVLCFTSKRAAQSYYGLSSSGDIHYGRQDKKIGQTVIFVLPSPSPAAIRWWNENYWLEAGAYVKNLF
ncbi:MAG: mismatch-specific DNA-glycosylase [Acidaminococcaceae bacterium]